MTAKRLYHSMMLALKRGGKRRGDYLRKHGILHRVGKNVTVQSRKIPLYPELISLHDNVHLASRVTFITHDIAYRMLNADPEIPRNDYKETAGCIEILDNVFVGAGTTILYNVRIGSNVIVAAGSVVTKDIPENVVAAGNPCRVLRSIGERDREYFYKNERIDWDNL